MEINETTPADAPEADYDLDDYFADLIEDGPWCAICDAYGHTRNSCFAHHHIAG